jgi:hypothetical protein
MKKSVLILGIALVSFSNIGNAKNSVSSSYNLSQNAILSDDKGAKANKAVKFEKPSLVEDTETFKPETVIAHIPKTVLEIIIEGDKIVENMVSDNAELIEYEESMKKIIAQSDLITENAVPNVTYSLYIERSVEDEIAELELIIESNESNQTISLNLKQINSNRIIF